MSAFFINILSPDDRQNDRDYKSTVRRQVSASVEMGFHYTLVTLGHKRRDPWITAQYAMQMDERFSPLIAINPFYVHPLAAAQRMNSLRELYPNRCAFNLITGSFTEELRSVVDAGDFAARNRRLREFFHVLQLLKQPGRVSFDGEFYRLKAAEIFPKTQEAKASDFFVSGTLQAEWPSDPTTYFVRNLRPESNERAAGNAASGLGVGICARATQDEAETAVNDLFPEDRGAELLFSMALKNSETPWNNWLRPYLESHNPNDPDYNLSPMRFGRSSAPYLVGSYERVAERLYQLAKLGNRFFLLDFAPGDEEHVFKCLEQFRKLEGDKR